MGGLREPPAPLSTAGSSAWPPVLGGMGSGHLPLSTQHRPGQPSVRRARPSLTVGGWRGDQLRGGPDRLQVKFSVWSSAAAPGPLATSAATWAPLPGGGRGWLRLRPDRINLYSGLRARGTGLQQGVRSGSERSGAERCEVRSQPPGLLSFSSQPRSLGTFPSTSRPQPGPVPDPPAPAGGATTGQGLRGWGPEGLSLPASHSLHQSGAKEVGLVTAGGVAPRAAPGWPGERAHCSPEQRGV